MKAPLIIPTVFDTSAMVKFVVRENGSEALHAYVGKYMSSFFVTSWTVGEALGVLKRLWLKRRLDDRAYEIACSELVGIAHDSGWNIQEVKLHDIGVFGQCAALSRRRKIDLVDATQLVLMKCSLLRFFEGRSAPILVTADEDLCVAARAEGFRVWNCEKEAPPYRHEIEYE